MSNVNKLKPIATALGATLIAGLAATPIAQADENPFAVSEMENGYMVAMASSDKKKDKEGKCGEGKCGGDKKDKEGKCGEGKCGGDKKDKEGKCGEGKCGGDKKDKEGKCGEGKCGGDKKASKDAA